MNNETKTGFDKTSNTGFRHLINATRFSYNGLRAAVKNESAFRQELALMLISIPLALWITASSLEFALLMAVNLLVLIVELLNSAIEAAIDRISLEHHPLSGLSKDYGSAAVMMSLLLAAIVWVAMFLNYLSVDPGA
jgi:diacylglycerol kinase (ATP)